MTNLPQVFDYNGSTVRTVEKDGEVWFVAKDMCDVLEISKYRDAVSRLDADERGSVKVDTLGGMQEMTAINEPGLYDLVLRSNKPEAKKFSRWVRHEVLPQIRKTGSYSVNSSEPLNVRVRVAELLQRLALQVTDKSERELINREAYKYATGREMPEKRAKQSTVGASRYWTAEQVGGTLKWPVDAVMYRAENLGITKKERNGYWDGGTWYFSKEGRKKFLELVRDKIMRIEDGFAYYEGGYKKIYWSYDYEEGARI